MGVELQAVAGDGAGICDTRPVEARAITDTAPVARSATTTFGQNDRGPQSAFGAVLQPDIPAVAADDGPGDGKAQTRAARVAAPRLVEPDAGFEHPLQIGLRDAWTVVLNDDEHTSVVVRDPRRCPDAVGARILQQVAGGAAQRHGRQATSTRLESGTASSWPRSGRSAATLSINASRSTVRVPSFRMSSRMNAWVSVVCATQVV